MSKFQRIQSAVFGILTILFALMLALFPEHGCEAAAAVIGILMLVYGFRLLIYYFTMARHMVGGKSTMYHAVIILDLGLFALSTITMSSYITMFFLLGVFAFSGLVGLLRSLESRRAGAPWKAKMLGACLRILLALSVLASGIVFRKQEVLLYGFCVYLILTGISRTASAFKKAAIVYVQ